MTQADYIHIGKEHFYEVILPKIKEISTQVTENLLVFIEGSVAYGYCDEKSDIDMDFFINADISEEIRKQITDVFCGDTYWREAVRVSYGLSGEYWKIQHIVNNDLDRFWREFNPYAVNNLVQAISIWDPNNLLPLIKARVSFYPEEMKKRVIRGLWLTVNDSGMYNLKEASERNKKCEAEIYLYRAVEAILRLSYILNDRYYPPTKWLSKGIGQLSNTFGLLKMLDELNKNNNLEDIYTLFTEVCQSMQQYMSENNSIEKESIENYPNIFSKPFYVFNSF